jgi:hypothetical protein
MPVADAPNRVWAVDFQFDATTDGRPIKIVSIVDEHTRECLGGLVDRSITADVLIDELDTTLINHGSVLGARPSWLPEVLHGMLAVSGKDGEQSEQRAHLAVYALYFV